MKATHKIVASFAGAALLVALGALMLFWAFRQMEEASVAREHSYAVIKHADDLLSSLKDAETSQRGYLLTGNEAFLEPYLAVRDSVVGDLKELRQLTKVSAAQKHLDALAPLMDAKLSEMAHVIELRRNNDMAAALAIVRNGQGKQLMDLIRAEMRSVIRIEEDALTQHEAEFQSNMRLLFTLIVTASLFALLSALSFTYLVYRGTRHLLGIQEATNKQLQAANKELETFSYSVSHDLRAPLRHVMGFVNLLQQDAVPVLSEKSLRHLTIISESTKRMGDLIDDLLAFSRIGRTELKKTEVNLEELVRETLGDFQAETKERKIACKVHPLPTVQADRALLRLVLVNLISNAVKFTGARAEAKIEIGCAPDKNGATVIFIRDNGAGFDPLYAHKLFGIFQRLHSQEEFEGTGIGLANVQRIIHRHGGRVWAEGVVDGGATFYFSIPKQPNGVTNGH
jgi:signal transduction histidine kinase